MSTVLDTGADFPWMGLQPFLANISEDGSDRIEYVPFLLRYQNPLVMWLIDKWCDAAMDQIAYKVQGNADVVFARLDAEGLGKVDFDTIRHFITGHLWKLSTNKVEQEYQ